MNFALSGAMPRLLHHATGTCRRRFVCIGLMIPSCDWDACTKPLGLLTYVFAERSANSASQDASVYAAHARHAHAATDRGDLLLSGFLSTQRRCAVFVCLSEDSADRFAEGDPFVKA